MWRDALQIAGWDAHVVQPALIAAGISNYGCHTPADAPWEKYGCISVWMALAALCYDAPLV